MRRRPVALLAGALVASAALSSAPLYASDPESGGISTTTTTTSWSGEVRPSTADGCDGPADGRCDNFALSVSVPEGGSFVSVVLVPEGASDWDFQVFAPDGLQVISSGQPPGLTEEAKFRVETSGTYTVSAAPYAVVGGYTASATLLMPAMTADGSTAPAPGFIVHTPPADGRYLGWDAAEPTLGINEKTGAVMYMAGLETLRVTFDDADSATTWIDVSAPLTSVTTFDPILYTQQDTGRTCVSQLVPGEGSLMSCTSDDGDTWTPSAGGGVASGLDHQSLGGGPYPATDTLPRASTRAMYYCAQDLIAATCSQSRDGGLTFGPPVPLYDFLDCLGLHGHPKVAPDGTVYVPNPRCWVGGELKQAVVVSTDGGRTWEVRILPGTGEGAWDPSVAVANDGTVYVVVADDDGATKVLTSSDRGRTWSSPVDVGAAVGSAWAAFPVAVAGDGDRAAVAWLGTTTEGAGNDGGPFGDDPDWPEGPDRAEWHLYTAFTYDGGRSWATTNATPGDPVQRGTIFGGGFTADGAQTRNLLDFMDATVDEKGRMLVGFADGCRTQCVTDVEGFSGHALASIARQSQGLGLLAQHDPDPTPTGPVAVDDTATTQQGKPVRISVLANDTSSDGSRLRIVNLTQPRDGTVTDKDRDGTLTYRPAPGFAGQDAFTYVVEDTAGRRSQPATVRIDVSPRRG